MHSRNSQDGKQHASALPSTPSTRTRGVPQQLAAELELRCAPALPLLQARGYNH